MNKVIAKFAILVYAKCKTNLNSTQNSKHVPLGNEKYLPKLVYEKYLPAYTRL